MLFILFNLPKNEDILPKNSHEMDIITNKKKNKQRKKEQSIKDG